MAINMGNPSDEQWNKMQKFIKSDKYKKDDFFVFETLAVGDKIVPNRYMRLTPNLLNVMKDDAQKGVSLMLNHNWGQFGVQSIPIGKVFDARIDGSSQDGESKTLYTTQYILKDDSKVDGYSKNDIIKLIETGILADTSVGWGTTNESYKCSICKNPYYSSKCRHIKGGKYITDEENNIVEQCIIEAEAPKELHEGNNVLMENSVVFDGAYPNAIIQSKFDNLDKNNNFKTLEEKEELSEKDIIFGYSSNNSINLLYKDSNEKGGVVQMSSKNEEINNEEINNEDIVQDAKVEENASNGKQDANVHLNETVDNVDNSINNSDEESVENVNKELSNKSNEKKYSEKELLEKFENISDSLEGLIQLAKEGLENRNEVISQALESGIHSMGNAFNKEIFVKTFSSMNTKDIKEMGKTWEQQAKMQFSDKKISKIEVQENKTQKDEEIDYSNFSTI